MPANQIQFRVDGKAIDFIQYSSYQLVLRPERGVKLSYDLTAYIMNKPDMVRQIRATTETELQQLRDDLEACYIQPNSRNGHTLFYVDEYNRRVQIDYIKGEFKEYKSKCEIKPEMAEAFLKVLQDRASAGQAADMSAAITQALQQWIEDDQSVHLMVDGKERLFAGHEGDRLFIATPANFLEKRSWAHRNAVVMHALTFEAIATEDRFDDLRRDIMMKDIPHRRFNDFKDAFITYAAEEERSLSPQ